MALDVKFTDNSGIFLKLLSEKKEQALKAIGMTAESYAKRDCPVDTGRLRNSITHEVRSEEDAVYIGSNVEYAAIVEIGSSRRGGRPYLKPAATDHSKEYKAIAEAVFRS